MENNLMENLNKEQLEAVMHKDGPLLIVAGAGTGKTTVITQKIAYIIEQSWAKPDEILALTFTEKAAGEMEERVDRLLPIGYLDLWISTFHSFAERIIKTHGLEIGLPSGFKLLNEFEQWILIKKNLEKFNLDYYRPAGNPTKFINALLRHFSRLKDEDISTQEYLDYAENLKQNVDNMMSGGKTKKITNYKLQITNVTDFKDADGKFSQEIAEQEVMRVNEIANAYHVYQQLLLDEGGMDFGDLINYCLKLFRERPAILEKYKQQFKYILVDEFQDTNWAQYELVKMLANEKNPATSADADGRVGNLTVVGDDDQSIYRFRGASMSNILQFKKDYPKSKQIALIKNYRNNQNILDLSYDFIKQNDPNRLEYQLSQKPARNASQTEAGGSKVKSEKLNKKLEAQVKGKGTIEVIKGEDLNNEVGQVIEKIADLKIKDKSSNWNDFAILVRANETAKEYCSTLDLADFPYQFLASRGLYSKPVIMDLIAYLKLLDDYHESRAMYRILNLPIFQFSYQELVNFNYWAGKKSWSLHEVLKSASSFKLGSEVIKKIDKVLSLIAKHTSLVREKSVSEIVIAFLNDSGYLKYLTSQDEQKSRETAQYLNQFLKRIKTFEAGSDEKTVKAFLDELNMEINSGETGSLIPDLESGPEAIKVMTVHGAKGLEFKYVFLVGLVDKRFPTIERREQILIPDALIKEILPEGDIHLEEERRLFYVAMTRAKEHLYFSWAPDYGGLRKKKPSRFLEECGLIFKKAGVILELKAIESREKAELQDSTAPALLRNAIGRVGRFTPSRMTKDQKETQIKLPGYYSYTQLSAFKNCPYQYRFSHILKIPRRGKHTFSFGQSMHLTLQKLYMLLEEKKGLGQKGLFDKDTPLTKGGVGGLNSSQNPLNPPLEGGTKINFDEILKIYEENWIDDWYENKRQKEEMKKLGKEILKNYYEKYKDNWPKVKSLEQGVNLKLKGYRIYGKIDRIDDIGNGEIQIVDYKTGQPKNKDKISLEEKEQLLIYQMAIEQATDSKVKNLQFYYLNNNTEINFLGSKENISEMENKIIDNINKIEESYKRGEFPPKPGPLCKFCDFFDICEFRKS